MKRMLIIWVVALFSVVSIPALSYVSADPCMESTSGDCDYQEYSGPSVPQGSYDGGPGDGSGPKPGTYNGTSPTRSSLDRTLQKSVLWADAFIKWCIEDGYGFGHSGDICYEAGILYQDSLNAYLAVMLDYAEGTVKVQPNIVDPRNHYPDWYPGGNKGPSAEGSRIPAPGTVHPGTVPYPVPERPTRAPSIRCSCHLGTA